LNIFFFPCTATNTSVDVTLSDSSNGFTFDIDSEGNIYVAAGQVVNVHESRKKNFLIFFFHFYPKEIDFLGAGKNQTGRIIGQYAALDAIISVSVGKGSLKNFLFVLTQTQLQLFEIQNDGGKITVKHFFFNLKKGLHCL
jgi:hypothetical protein